MGRTLPSITYVLFKEQKSLGNFRRALSRSDQLMLDELFTNTGLHLAPAAYAAHTLPIEIFLLAMLLEEHKEVMRLRGVVGDVLDN
jgi:hypothetical protein